MMPLSVAALISGMMTLVATAPNLVVNSELVRHGAAGFHFFSFTPFGVPILVLGIVYMLFARRWLAASPEQAAAAASRPSLRDWIERYQLADREHRVRDTRRDSPLVGKTLGGTRSAQHLRRQHRRHRAQPPLRPRSRSARPQTPSFARTTSCCRSVPAATPTGRDAPRSGSASRRCRSAASYFTDRSQEIGMAEVMLPATSDLVGKTVVGGPVPQPLRPDGDRSAARQHGAGGQTCGTKS